MRRNVHVQVDRSERSARQARAEGPVGRAPRRRLAAARRVRAFERVSLGWRMFPRTGRIIRLPFFARGRNGNPISTPIPEVSAACVAPSQSQRDVRRARRDSREDARNVSADVLGNFSLFRRQIRHKQMTWLSTFSLAESNENIQTIPINSLRDPIFLPILDRHF